MILQAEYLVALALLCCHYIDPYNNYRTVSFNTAYVQVHSHSFFWAFIVWNSNWFCWILPNLFQVNLDYAIWNTQNSNNLHECKFLLNDGLSPLISKLSLNSSKYLLLYFYFIFTTLFLQISMWSPNKGW